LELLHNPDPADILTAIAGVRLSAGSSLHGNLVALAYGVPHVGFGERVRKLDLVLRTWDPTSPDGAPTRHPSPIVLWVRWPPTARSCCPGTSAEPIRRSVD